MPWSYLTTHRGRKGWNIYELTNNVKNMTILNAELSQEDGHVTMKFIKGIFLIFEVIIKSPSFVTLTLGQIWQYLYGSPQWIFWCPHRLGQLKALLWYTLKRLFIFAPQMQLTLVESIFQLSWLPLMNWATKEQMSLQIEQLVQTR